eukprot:jgi/Mesvir1/3849/Mv19814-RA.1
MASVVSTATSMLHRELSLNPDIGVACMCYGHRRGSMRAQGLALHSLLPDAGRDKPERNTIFDDPKSFVKEVWNSRKAAEAVDGEDVLWSMRVDLTRALVGGEMPLSYQRLEKCMDCEGVTDGAQLRLRDQGDVGFAEGKTGNLVLRVEVPASGYVNGLRTWREDGHVYSEVPKVMVVGSEPSTVDVQLLDGKKGQLKVPADAKNGTTLRLKGRGSPLAVGKDEKGDLCFVIAEVVRSP